MTQDKSFLTHLKLITEDIKFKNKVGYIRGIIKVLKMFNFFGVIRVIKDPQYYHKKWDYLETFKK